MSQFPLAGAASLLLVAGPALAASRPDTVDVPVSAHVGVVAGGIIGALLGGPPGALAGAALGGYTGERTHEAGKVESLQASNAALSVERDRLASERESLQADLAQTRRKLALEHEAAAEVASAAALAHGLAFGVGFRTDSAEPPDLETDGLAALAALVNAVPELEVQLDGYADPRGTEDHNLQLSTERAEAIRRRLVELGVDAGRIRVAGHGATTSADAADPDAWAFERRVSIRLGLSEDRLAARP